MADPQRCVSYQQLGQDLEMRQPRDYTRHAPGLQAPRLKLELPYGNASGNPPIVRTFLVHVDPGEQTSGGAYSCLDVAAWHDLNRASKRFDNLRVGLAGLPSGLTSVMR